MPLFLYGGSWHLLYTRRTDHVESHQGQVSFPGGVIEEGDSSPQEAALREAEEEIGLNPEEVEILGSMDHLLTVTQFRIIPIVGLIPWPYPYQLNPIEVARVFGVPIQWLMDPQNQEIQYRKPLLSGPAVPVIYFKPYQEEVIWGATAKLTVDFLEIWGQLME